MKVPGLHTSSPPPCYYYTTGLRTIQRTSAALARSRCLGASSGRRMPTAATAVASLSMGQARKTATNGFTLHTSEWTGGRRVFAVESGNPFSRLYLGCGMSGWRWGGGVVSSPDHTPTSP